MLWFTESTEATQVGDPAASAEDSAVQTLAGEPSVVEFVVASVAVEAATTITVLEVLATTLVSDEPVVGLTPAQVELVLVSHSVMERGSGSASAGLSPATDIMKELARQMVRQFFASMKSCIDLVLSGGSSFEFARMLLENQIENIHHTGSPSQARTYLVLVEQLGICLKELKTLENAISMDEARSILSKLLPLRNTSKRIWRSK